MSMMPTQYTQRPQRGTTLVEVLIAALIIGIGLLGIASLQVKALQASTNAEYRAAATDIASALADRIRANLPQLNSYVSAPLANCTSTIDKQCASSPDESTTAEQCTANKMAEYDLYTIRCAEDSGAKNKLPGGEVSVTCDGACDGTTTMHIKVSWVVRNDVFGETNSQGNSSDSITLSMIPGVDPE